MKKLALLVGLGLATLGAPVASAEEEILVDAARQREIPIEVYRPPVNAGCSPVKRCPVALISGGSGSTLRAYTFLARALNELGYLVIEVLHELPGDPPIPREGDLIKLRSPFWQQGGASLLFVRAHVAAEFPAFDGSKVLLLGHSHGGDISVWLATHEPDAVAGVVTLDHRRNPLPRVKTPRLLTLRGNDFEADPGVLPSEAEAAALGIRIVKLQGQHNDLWDGGSDELKAAIVDHLRRFLATTAE